VRSHSFAFVEDGNLEQNLGNIPLDERSTFKFRPKIAIQGPILYACVLSSPHRRARPRMRRIPSRRPTPRSPPLYPRRPRRWPPCRSGRRGRNGRRPRGRARFPPPRRRRGSEREKSCRGRCVPRPGPEGAPRVPICARASADALMDERGRRYGRREHVEKKRGLLRPKKDIMQSATSQPAPLASPPRPNFHYV